MVRLRQTGRYLVYALFTCEKLSWDKRLDLVLKILQHTVLSPVSGFAWILDEILYGNLMNQCTIEQPFFVVSAFRSASTQMARELAHDPRFYAPNASMCNFPYLWLWKLVTWIVDDAVTLDEARAYLNKSIPREFLERHDSDPFAIDTFDSSFLSSHLNGLSWRMGPAITTQEFNTAVHAPHNRYLFENAFVQHVDRIARKAMIFLNASPDQHFLLKGHFLSSAPALANRYPEARFLSVLRDPLARIQSGVNYMAVNPTLGRPPDWQGLVTSLEEMEILYSQREMDFYGVDDPKRLAVRFDDFVNKKDRTMKRIYQHLLHGATPPLNTAQVSKGSSSAKTYSVNLSLEELGVNSAALRERFQEYYEWMKSKQ